MKVPMRPRSLPDILRTINLQEKAPLLFGVSPLPDGAYYHWDQLRHRTPPKGLTHEEWWAGVAIAREHLKKTLPLLDKESNPFTYSVPDPVFRALHEIDQGAAGRIRLAEEVANPAARDRYIFNSLIEESVTSSQLEGASTTTEVAKHMLRSGRKPTDRSEQMILNNYNAMQFVQESAGRPLTPELVFQLHRIVTDATLDNPDRAGTFRTDDDRIAVEDHHGNVLHVPPPAAELAARMETMCVFANERLEHTFVHPVLRAILLHFWVGYDHPFVDGNGRTARALFYWCMLSQGYGLAEYISISRILQKAPAQYGRSFLYTETDNNDTTYFVDYQLRVIRKAIDELQGYLRRKLSEVRQVESLLRRSVDFNHRQLALLSHALKHPGMQYTFESHRRSHRVVYQTARADLLDLATRGLLLQRKVGNRYGFSAPPQLAEHLRNLKA